MTQTLFTVSQNIYAARLPSVLVETTDDDAVDARMLRSLLDTAVGDSLGVSAVYREHCQLSSIAFSTLTRCLVITVPECHIRRAKNDRKQALILRARKLLQDHVLCSPRYQKYAFRMDRVAVALHLDMSLRIDGAVELLSLSTHNRRSPAAMKAVLAGVTTGELVLREHNVKNLFFRDGEDPPSVSEVALQAWAACKAATLTQNTPLLVSIPRINTRALPGKHVAALAKISRDGDRLDALKPTSAINDVKETFTTDKDVVNLTCSRFPTRIRTSANQYIRIETQIGETTSYVVGHTRQTEGREAHITVDGPIKGDTIVSVTTVGKDDPTCAQVLREDIILGALQNNNNLLSQPFFCSMWLPNEPLSWLVPNGGNLEPLIYFPSCPLNASQDTAVQRIISDADADRIVLIQGPPGTGKTTVIAAAITSIIEYGDPDRTVWIAAQSNVAVKNIAEKLDSVGFYDFRLLVSKDFHLGWHEHLYERLEPCLIRSDTFNDVIVDAARMLQGARVILCTLSMLSHPRIGVFSRIVPVDIILFDEASQIEAGDYVPMLNRFQATLSKVVFIGDNKQLAPHGQEEIPELCSVFEFAHLRKKAIFLNTQYRMPTVIGDFISWNVYNSKLRTDHNITDPKACRYVDVARGQEFKMGHSWANREEATAVVRLAHLYNTQRKSFRIITPYDGQRSLIENELKSARLPWEDKVFNVDSFQGNEDDHIIVSVVRSRGVGFLKNQRRVNVMLTRFKRSMVICTSRSFLTHSAVSTLVGKLAVHLGPHTWIDERNVVRGMLA